MKQIGSIAVILNYSGSFFEDILIYIVVAFWSFFVSKNLVFWIFIKKKFLVMQILKCLTVYSTFNEKNQHINKMLK